MTDSALCPCGTGKEYAACCGRYLDAGDMAATAEALMRSRYSAYTLLREAYLLATWHVSTRPEALNLDEDKATRWLGLSVKRAEQLEEEQAQVEFVARYKIHGRAYRLHEISHFVRENGRWFYVTGVVDES